MYKRFVVYWGYKINFACLILIKSKTLHDWLVIENQKDFNIAWTCISITCKFRLLIKRKHFLHEIS